MFRSGTIFIAALLYVGFLILRTQNEALANTPAWLAVIVCLIAAALIRASRQAARISPTTPPADTSKPITTGDAPTVAAAPPENVPDPSPSPYVRLLTQTHRDIAYGYTLMFVALIPRNACELSVHVFLEKFAPIASAVNAAAGLREFDADEVMLAHFGEAILITDKSFYKLGEAPFYIPLADIERHTIKGRFGRDHWQIARKDGSSVEFDVSWGVAASNDIESQLEAARRPETVEALRTSTLEYRRELEKIRTGG